MMQYIKQARKSLTTIELEAGEKHPAKPDYRRMRREAEELIHVAKAILGDINELSPPLEF